MKSVALSITLEATRVEKDFLKDSIIYKRHSVRRYKPDPIKLEHLDHILHAAMAALSDDAYHQRQTRRIVAERARLSTALRELGMHVWESGGNFVPVDARRSHGRAEGLADALLEHGIVVRPFGDVLRISIGVEHENDAVIAAMRQIVGEQANY
jgi:hypothetical protein